MSALPFPDPPLADATTALREWDRTDTAQKFAAFSDPVCLRFSWPHVEPFTEVHVREQFDENERARLRGDAINFAVVHALDRDDIRGGAAIYDLDRDQARAAVGYWLPPHARGRGVATRTVLMLARWAFDELAVARLELTCAPDNVASQRVAERCGFVREGVLRSHIRFKEGRRDT